MNILVHQYYTLYLSDLSGSREEIIHFDFMNCMATPKQKDSCRRGHEIYK